MTSITVPRTSLSTTIQEVTSDYVGALMAKVAGTAHMDRLGIKEEQLTSERVEAVLGSLQSSLKVLVGDETARKAVAEIKRRIGVA